MNNEFFFDPIDSEDPKKYTWNIEEDIKLAKVLGMTVIESTDTTLLLDLDDTVSLDTYNKMFRTLENLFTLREVGRWTSQSGKGLHIVLSCVALSFPERVALQACLGSDKVREGLAIAMARDGKQNPSVLFKPK